MAEVLSQFKDYIGILLGAAISLVTLLASSRLTERRERRKVFWEREHAKFNELQEVAGCLVEEVLRYGMRTDEGRKAALERLQFVRAATGRFLRYKSVASALRDLENAAGWYMSQDMKHESRAENEKARSEVDEAFQRLTVACAETLRSAPNEL
jgi:hypothetical protein